MKGLQYNLNSKLSLADGIREAVDNYLETCNGEFQGTEIEVIIPATVPSTELPKGKISSKDGAVSILPIVGIVQSGKVEVLPATKPS